MFPTLRYVTFSTLSEEEMSSEEAVLPIKNNLSIALSHSHFHTRLKTFLFHKERFEKLGWVVWHTPLSKVGGITAPAYNALGHNY